jgi:hypothetical protein
MDFSGYACSIYMSLLLGYEHRSKYSTWSSRTCTKNDASMHAKPRAESSAAGAIAWHQVERHKSVHVHTLLAVYSHGVEEAQRCYSA